MMNYIDCMEFNKFNPTVVTVDGEEYAAIYALDRAARTITVTWGCIDPETGDVEERRDVISADHPAYLEARHTCMAYYREMHEEAPARIKQERQRAVADERKPWIGSTISGKGYSIYFNGHDHRTVIQFSRRPSGRTIEAVKAENFHYSPNRQAWLGKLDAAHHEAAQRLTMVFEGGI